MGAGPRIDFTLNPNTANPFYYTWVDGNDTPINYTGFTFKLQVKARDSNDEPTGAVLLTLETGSGIAGTLANGEFTLTFPASSAGGLVAGSYIYDCLRISGGGGVEPMLWGLIDVPAGITTP